MRSFAEATAVQEVADGRYACAFFEDWGNGRTQFGGMATGVLYRAMAHSVGDRARPVRSLTVHCTAPVVVGPAEIQTRVERVGKYVTHLTARLEQAGAVVALATAVFGAGRADAVEYQTAVMPAVPDPKGLEPAPSDHPLVPAFAKNFEYRYCLGGVPFSAQEGAEGGGFIRPRVDTRLDAPLAAALLDAFPTIAMARAKTPVLTATIDFNFQFFEVFDGTRPAGPLGPDDHLVHLQGRWAGDGYSEELRSLWGPDGKLLAQCRQNLAVRPAG